MKYMYVFSLYACAGCDAKYVLGLTFADCAGSGNKTKKSSEVNHIVEISYIIHLTYRVTVTYSPGFKGEKYS